MALTEYLTKEDWLEIAKTVLDKVVDVVDVRARPLGSTGGFLGEHYYAAVTVRTRRSQRVLKFFVKGTPTRLDFQRQLVESTGSFQTEILAFEVLFPDFQSALLDEGKGMEWSCKCFFTLPDVLVFEDLSAQGFELIDNRGPITYEHIALALTCLANLHSASLIFEETHPLHPIKLTTIYPSLASSGFFRHAPNEPGTKWLETCVEGILAVVKLLHGDDTVKKMKTRVKEAMGHMFDFQIPSEKYRNVIGQGDLKRDNILFRHENGKPVAAYIVDYQLIRYMPPANDVTCLLYISTDRKFREDHGANLLKHYYDCFSRNLRRHSLDPEKLLSWEEFRESCEFYKSLGVMIAACYAPYIFMKNERLADIFSSNEEFENFVLGDRVADIIKSFETDAVFRSKVSAVIEELLEFIQKS